MEEWTYSSTILDLGTRWCQLQAPPARALYLGGNRLRYPQEAVSPRVVLDAEEKRKILPLPGIETPAV
jgi:hypothetical protein